MHKQHILAEIRRTATANGGRPLGKERFYRETGINESDWLGKHWARWSDAIRESGFEPNQMQGALDESAVIESFISLMRELRKFPTANEIKLKARNAPGFPWHNTFSRFGPKHQFARRIQEYCRGREGYEDVAAICFAIIGDRAAVDEDIAVETNTREGFVYMGLLKIGKGRRYKIGKTNLVERRSNELSLQLPEKMALVHYINTDDIDGIEKYWHERFAQKNTNGEWFDLDSGDIKAFKRRKFM